MSNILQVTDPSTYIDNRNVHIGQEQQSALNSSQIQNPSDPSRVVRADGQKSGTAGDQENESGFSIRNYKGNYTDFLQKLGQENEIKDSCSGMEPLSLKVMKVWVKWCSSCWILPGLKLLASCWIF